ncbi:MAG TPA: ABC transporter substrate-binding protein [Ktedonobacterales bacterium]|nr:ABC transporter substrate-binding protein [Ktedonobacterales bacterium]
MIPSLRRSLVALALLAVLVPQLAGCAAQSTASPPSGNGKLDDVTLALDWTPNTNHTGIYVAMAKGWYAQHGIKLTLLPYSSSVAPETLVATNKADFAISFTESVTSARAAGQPLVSIAAVIQHNTSALISLKGAGLDTVASLNGKRYAGFGAPYEQPVIDQVLSCGGAGNPTFRNITTTLDPVEALKSKQFDFAWVYEGWEVIQAQREGLQVNVFPITDYCIPDYYSPVIISSQSFIASHSDVIKRFLAATSQGYTYAVQHPKDAADLLIKGAPAGTFDDTGLVYASQSYLSPQYQADAKCWGYQLSDKWTAYPQFMYNHQAIQDANGNPIKSPPDYAAAFTNQFLPPCS